MLFYWASSCPQSILSLGTPSMQVPGNGSSAPAQLLWAAPNPGQGSWQPLDLALVPAPQAPLPAAAVLAADDRGQVGLHCRVFRVS